MIYIHYARVHTLHYLIIMLGYKYARVHTCGEFHSARWLIPLPRIPQRKVEEPKQQACNLYAADF